MWAIGHSSGSGSGLDAIWELLSSAMVLVLNEVYDSSWVLYTLGPTVLIMGLGDVGLVRSRDRG